MLDILIYLFENYVENDVEGGHLAGEPDRETLRTELEQAGFAAREIEQALMWLESLTSAPVRGLPATSRALRVFDAGESARLDVACQGYLLRLEQLGILSAVQREWVIDRLLALSGEEIELEQVKWVVLMVLFSQPGEANAYARMEDLVFEEQGEHVLH